jgi:hypothetical protein
MMLQRKVEFTGYAIGFSPYIFFDETTEMVDFIEFLFLKCGEVSKSGKNLGNKRV